MLAHLNLCGDACREAAERQPPPAPLDVEVAPGDVLLPAGRLSAVLDGTLVVQARALDFSPKGAGAQVALAMLLLSSSFFNIILASLVVEDVKGLGSALPLAPRLSRPGVS